MTDSKTPDWVKEEAHEALSDAVRDERSGVSIISQALLSAYERGRKEGIEEAASHLVGLAKATPLGHESIHRGRSTYNWLTYCATAIRQLLEDHND